MKGNIISDPIEGTGVFTNPTGKKIDMLKLFKYCKDNKIPYEKLTETEIGDLKIYYVSAHDVILPKKWLNLKMSLFHLFRTLVWSTPARRDGRGLRFFQTNSVVQQAVFALYVFRHICQYIRQIFVL